MTMPGMSRGFIVLLVALSLALWSPPSAAVAQQRSCYGCNIADDGRLTPSLVGQRIFYRGNNQVIPVTVIGVDARQGLVGWRDESNGDTGWGYATSYYTRARSDERDIGWMCVILCPIALAVGAAAASGSSSSSSSGSSGQSRERQRSDCIQQCRRQTNYNDLRSEAAGQDCIRRCERGY